MSQFTLESARAFLRSAAVFYGEDVEDPRGAQMLNMNDTWGWAVAWGEYVPDEKLIEVAELFWSYGWAGCLYWTSERRDRMRSEFHHINRQIDFVRAEEEFTKRMRNSSELAYTPYTYTLGVVPTAPDATGR